jgi:hypothetical protein
MVDKQFLKIRNIDLYNYIKEVLHERKWDYRNNKF